MPITTYEHHGARVFVEERLKGKHREYRLCWKCQNFHPGAVLNCPKAARLYQLCVEENMTTPVFECPEFLLYASSLPPANTGREIDEP